MTEQVQVNGGAPALDLKATKAALTSSSTSSRIAQLRAVDDKISQKCMSSHAVLPARETRLLLTFCRFIALDKQIQLQLLKLLFWTHSFYGDRDSRLAVQRCLVSIFKEGDADLLTPLVEAIRREAPKPSIATSNAFVLLEWCSLLMQNLAGTPHWDKFGKDIIAAAADALEKCCLASSKSGVSKSALVTARRGFRKLVSVPESRDKTITEAVQALSAKAAQPSPKNAVMLGVIAGVCSRKAEAKPILDKQKSHYFSFYVREILGSKTPVPKHQAAGLGDFFSAFVTPEEFEKEVVAPLEKGLLRAPEIVLNDLITPLVKSLPKDWDLSRVLQGHLLKSLLSNTKSSNAVVRSGALAAFRVVADRCHDLELMEKVTDEIVTPLKGGKLASPDHRVLHCEMLLAVPMSGGIATKIATGLPVPIGKEGNEAALTAETSVLSRSVKALLSDGTEIPKAVTDAYAKGLVDKKLPSRRIWVLSAGDVFNSFQSDNGRTPAYVKFGESVLPPLFDTYNEVLKNPLKSSQDGTITAAFVVCAVAPAVLKNESNEKLTSLLKQFCVQKQCLELEPKPSFLLNPRVYSKLSSDDDARWLSRALSAVASSLPEDAASNVSSAWVHACLYLICSPSLTTQLRKEAADALAMVYLQNSDKIAKVVVNGIWDWISAVESVDKDSTPVLAKADKSNLQIALRSICLTSEDFKKAGKDANVAQLEEQMCSLLVLARARLIPRVAWIELCLRLGLDPGELAKKHEEVLLNEVVKRSEFSQPVSLRHSSDNASY